MDGAGAAICLVIGFLSLPVVALILALLAQARSKRAEKAAESLGEEIRLLRKTLETQGRALHILETQGLPDRTKTQVPSPPPATPRQETAASAPPVQAEPEGKPTPP